ncbi:hypothetical protein PRIPAC_77395 [Pristionchus pacificus]|uniref:G protein-coupled receptor n=1 Tax=Pristionchus pacificus TaxID=54126 RepID=A0A2A6CQ30_PRIPA|nr:hypothetical protein PRIPAC_77395 [Pristionchus pacificus]|eukprot:PDM80206.1 G protein-coupled receptor [Pristionchus pacificus]
MDVPVSFHQMFLRVTTVISLCGNGLLLLLLLHRRSTSLGNYRVLLIVFAITDIIISLFHIWYIPMFVLGRFGFIYYGYRSLFGKSAIAQNSNVLFSVTFYLPFFLIGIHFIYRYLLLARPSIVKYDFKRFMLFCAVYSIVYNTFFAFLSYCVCNLGITKRFYDILAGYEQRPLRSHINAAVVEYVTEDHEINFVAIFIILAAGSVGGHSILVSLVCVYKIFRALKHTVLDLTMKRVHIQLFRALLLQFSIPFIFSFLPFGAIVALPALGIPLGYTASVSLFFNGSTGLREEQREGTRKMLKNYRGFITQ